MNRAERRAAEREARRGPRPAAGLAVGPVDDTVSEDELADPAAIRPTVDWSAFEPLRSELVDDPDVLVPWGGPAGDGAFHDRLTSARLAAPLADRLEDDPDVARYADAAGLALEDAVAGLLDLWNDPTGMAGRPQDGPRILALHRAAEDAFALIPWRPLRAFKLWPTVEALYAEHGGALRAFLRAQYAEAQAWLRDAGVERAQLWRGLACRAPEGFGRVGLALAPLSSWTASPEVAAAFAAHRARTQGRAARLLLAEVPATRIVSVGPAGLGSASVFEVVVRSGPGAAWAMTWRDRPVVLGPLCLERTYRAAAEAWEDDASPEPVADPVWRPDWRERVASAAGARPAEAAPW